MKNFLQLLLTTVCLFVLIACGGANSSPEAYPEKPITLLVPWAAGGGTDLSSRLLAASLERNLGENVNVVNRTGGGGVVGHMALAQARPDGYTLGAITVEIGMMHWQGMTDLAPANYTPLALTMNNPAAITVRQDAPWQSVEELVAAIQTHPGQIKASGTSRGGIWDLARIGFLQTADLQPNDMPWVPSQGAAPALQELIAGGVEVVTAALAEVAPMMQAGEVRVLGVMSEERLPSFPEVPTLKEQGIDWQLGGWVGLGAPAGLPAEVQAQLITGLEAALQDSAYVAGMAQAGFYRQPLIGNAFANFLQEQDASLGKLMEQGGLTPQ